jgi:hypothetical protein
MATLFLCSVDRSPNYTTSNAHRGDFLGRRKVANKHLCNPNPLKNSIAANVAPTTIAPPHQRISCLLGTNNATLTTTPTATELTPDQAEAWIGMGTTARLKGLPSIVVAYQTTTGIDCDQVSLLSDASGDEQYVSVTTLEVTDALPKDLPTTILFEVTKEREMLDKNPAVSSLFLRGLVNNKNTQQATTAPQTIVSSTSTAAVLDRWVGAGIKTNTCAPIVASPPRGYIWLSPLPWM